MTPTWNRAAYLDRVWNGLNSQTYKHIEWIVANDGSSDETELIVRELAARSGFPVTLITASVHIGKARMDNESIAQARGEFILWNDSDDYLLPHAIEKLVATWNSIPEADRTDYVGVTALCAKENGVICSTSTPTPQMGYFDTTWNDPKNKLISDVLNLTKSCALKACPFPEVDFVIPEAVTWGTLGDRRVRVLSEALMIKEYRAPHAISFSGKMEYCRGRAYAIAITDRPLRTDTWSVTTRMWRLITYIRCSLHGEVSLRDQLLLWADNTTRVNFFMMMPMGYLLALKDRLQGKVRRTHREFLVASKQVCITCTRMGANYAGECHASHRKIGP